MIGYVASLQWGRIKLRYEGVTPIGKSSLKEQGNFLKVDLPIMHENTITWKFSQGVGSWIAQSPVVGARLLDLPNGYIHWRCFQPSSVVSIDGPHLQMKGLGYAEKIDLTIFPGNLPIKTLYWGRYVSGKNAIVWIRWIGPEPRLILYYNGNLIEGADVNEQTIVFGNYALKLPDQTFRKGTVKKIVFSGFKKIASMLPATSLSLYEEKWFGSAVLLLSGKVADHGNVIHEKVSWP